MRTLGVEEARQMLPTLLDEARAGRETVITRHGRPVAIVGPIERGPARAGVSIASLRGSGRGLWSGADGVGSQRDEWR